jgi:hypothetical protein
MENRRRALNRPSVHPEALAKWCREHLFGDPIRTIFEAGYLSFVVGLELSDGRETLGRVIALLVLPSARRHVLQ